MPLPNINPKTFSLSAIVVGYLLIDDLTGNEQNALGNWLMLVAQVICTNAFYKQVQTDRIVKQNIPSRDETILLLKKMIDALTIEVDSLKKEI